MKRYGQVIKVRPEKFEEYMRLHEKVWAGVEEMNTQCGLRNYTIFHKDGYLFAYFEYHGTDFEADMKRMAQNPLTQEWWKLCGPCQEPLPTRKPNEWWSNMEEVCHQD